MDARDTTGFASLYQMPETNSGAEAANNSWEYTVDYSQSMSMTQNDGNDPYLFDAQYKHVYVIDKARQTATIESPTRFWFAVRSTDVDKVPLDGYYQINGFSVTQVTKLSVFPLSMSFEHYSGSEFRGSDIHHIDFEF
ncbi:hypothetical protein HGRIS_003547 [Hohenbuehelia grisea]|uniref:Uncharacterized protein n=1 Tax=Hohenbuehelia grisea TaxID=104357 RepID=A0ABR3JGR5_9AGAR